LWPILSQVIIILLSYPAIYLHLKNKHEGVQPEGTHLPNQNMKLAKGRPKVISLLKRKAIKFSNKMKNKFKKKRQFKILFYICIIWIAKILKKYFILFIFMI